MDLMTTLILEAVTFCLGMMVGVGLMIAHYSRQRDKFLTAIHGLEEYANEHFGKCECCGHDDKPSLATSEQPMSVEDFKRFKRKFRGVEVREVD